MRGIHIVISLLCSCIVAVGCNSSSSTTEKVTSTPDPNASGASELKPSVAEKPPSLSAPNPAKTSDSEEALKQALKKVLADKRTEKKIASMPAPKALVANESKTSDAKKNLRDSAPKPSKTSDSQEAIKQALVDKQDQALKAAILAKLEEDKNKKINYNSVQEAIDAIRKSFLDKNGSSRNQDIRIGTREWLFTQKTKALSELVTFISDETEPLEARKFACGILAAVGAPSMKPMCELITTVKSSELRFRILEHVQYSSEFPEEAVDPFSKLFDIEERTFLFTLCAATKTIINGRASRPQLKKQLQAKLREIIDKYSGKDGTLVREAQGGL